MLFNDESELLDLEKELNEVELGYDAKDKRGESKAGDAKATPAPLAHAASYGRHSLPSGPPPSAIGMATPRGSLNVPSGAPDLRPGSAGGRGKVRAPAGPPPTMARPSTAGEVKEVALDDDSALSSTASAGGSSNRARILAQQRELLMKRRAEGLKGGVIRSVDSPARPSADPQFTPAIKQFSAPRPPVNDDPYTSFSPKPKDEDGTPSRPSTRGSDRGENDREASESQLGSARSSVSSTTEGALRRIQPSFDPSSTGSSQTSFRRTTSRDRGHPEEEAGYHRDHERRETDRLRRQVSGESPRRPPPEGPPPSARAPRRRISDDDDTRDKYRDRDPGDRERDMERPYSEEREPDRDRERGYRDRDERYYRERDERGHRDRDERGYREERYRDDEYGDRRPYQEDRRAPRGGYGRDDAPSPRRGYNDQYDPRDRDRDRDIDRDRERERERDDHGELYERDHRRAPPPRDDYDSRRPGSGSRPVDRTPRSARSRENEEDTLRKSRSPRDPGLPMDAPMGPSKAASPKQGRAEQPAPAKGAVDDDENEEGEEEDSEGDEEESEGDDTDMNAAAATKPGAGREESTKAEPAGPVENNLDWLDLSRWQAMAKFVSTPCPRRAGVVQCYIKRKKGGSTKLYPEYSVYVKQGDRFMLAAKKRAHSKTSNYLITLSDKDFDKDNQKYAGKLRANFVGTEFQIFSNGYSPKDGEDKTTGNSKPREELGVVLYASNVLGSRGPRRMQVSIPRVDPEDDSVMNWKEGGRPRDDEMLEKVRKGDLTKLHYFINKPPRWNDQVGAYVLNFNGRVTMASVKNFQLVDPDDQEHIVLQFGRVGKDEFTMDFQWPISPYQAFAVTLSSFDSKIACD